MVISLNLHWTFIRG